MSDEISLLEYGFKGAVTIILTTGAWLCGKTMTAVAKNRDDLAEHKLHVSENYAKKTEIGDVFDALNEVRQDIKILLGRHDSVR